MTTEIAAETANIHAAFTETQPACAHHHPTGRGGSLRHDSPRGHDCPRGREVGAAVSSGADAASHGALGVSVSTETLAAGAGPCADEVRSSLPFRSCPPLALPLFPFPSLW